MEFLKWVSLGLVQGLTEFLPISSSGHLIIFEKLFGMENNLVLVNLLLHVASVIPIIIIFKSDVIALIKKPINKTNGHLVITTCVTVIFAFGFKNLLPDILEGTFLPVCFLITALLLMIINFHKSDLEFEQKPFTAKNAVVVGLFQGIAVLPGLSRSGFTVASGIMQKNDRTFIAKYSFLASIPIILGGAIMECLTSEIVGGINIFYVGSAMVSCFCASLLAVKFMLSVIKNCNFTPFVIYLILIGIASLFII